MSKIDASEQVKFLVCCIRNTMNGKPDFTAVAEELSIVSKAAAQKRYERMLKSHGVGNKNAEKPDVKDEDEGTPHATPMKRKSVRSATADMRKIRKSSESDEEADRKVSIRAKKLSKADEKEASDSSALSEPPSS